MRRRTAAASLAVLLVSMAAPGQGWVRGVDPVATGTFGQGGPYVYGLAVTVATARDRWPTLCFGRGQGGRASDLSFGQVRLPGTESVTMRMASAEWAAAKLEYRAGDQTLLVTVSNLTPAIRLDMAGPRVDLFAPDAEGSRAPSHVAVQTAAGWRVLARGDARAAFEGDLTGPCVLAWFGDTPTFEAAQIPGVHGAPPIQGLDAPWLVLLDRRPERLALSADGLELTFAGGGSGIVQALPLYGSWPVERARTAGWAEAIPAEVDARCRELAAISRFYPAACREDGRIEGGGDVRLHQTFTYEQIDDAWRTRGRQVAPVPPAVGICLRFGPRFELPLEIAPAPRDLQYVTPHGPLYGVDGPFHDTVLRGGARYAREALRIRPGDDPVSREALARLSAQVRRILQDGEPFHFLSSSCNYEFFRFGARNERLYSLCQVLPLVGDDLREPLRRHVDAMLEQVLSAQWRTATVATPAGGVRTCRWPRTDGPAPGEEDLWNGVTLAALWAYGHYTGNWDALRPRREVIDALANEMLTRTDWRVGFELAGWGAEPFELTAQIEGLLAYARILHALGDAPAADRATCQAAKHLLGWYAMFFGTDWIASYAGRDHTAGANRFRGLVELMPAHLAGKTDIIFDTKITVWTAPYGPIPEGDPTLFLAPWTGTFPLSRDAMHRFWREHLRGEVSDVWDFYLFLWPETFNQFSADEMNNWGAITPLFQVKAFVLDGSPAWLLANLPWLEVTQDPFYLQNLRAILFAAGEATWEPLEVPRPQ